MSSEAISCFPHSLMSFSPMSVLVLSLIILRQIWFMLYDMSILRIYMAWSTHRHFAEEFPYHKSSVEALNRNRLQILVSQSNDPQPYYRSPQYWDFTKDASIWTTRCTLGLICFGPREAKNLGLDGCAAESIQCTSQWSQPHLAWTESLWASPRASEQVS